MAVSSENDRRNQYAASADQTVFAYDYKIGASSDLVVTQKVDATSVVTTLTETTHYEVSGVGSEGGGNVTLVTGAAANDIITIEGQTPATRASDFSTGGDFLATDVNTAEDRQYHIIQEILRDIGRTLFLPVSALDTVSATLPEPSGGDMLGWAADGLSLVNFSSVTTASVTAFMETLLDDANAAAARTTLGLGTAALKDTGTSGDVVPLLNALMNMGDKILQRALLKDYGEITVAKGNLGATPEFDLSAGNSFTGTADQEVTSSTFVNPTAGDELCGFSLGLTNGGAAAFAWPASVDWPGSTAPSLTTSGYDELVFWTRDGGTIWHGKLVTGDSS